MENINKNNDNNMMNNKSHIYISSNNPTGMLFLTHKNLQEFQTYKTKIMKFLETNKF